MKLYRVVEKYGKPISVVDVEARETDKQYRVLHRGWKSNYETIVRKDSMGFWRLSPSEAVAVWIESLQTSLAACDNRRDNILADLAHASDLTEQAKAMEEKR